MLGGYFKLIFAHGDRGMCRLVGYGAFNATFNNISVISWLSVLLVEETTGPEKTTDLSKVTDFFFKVSSIPSVYVDD